MLCYNFFAIPTKEEAENCLHTPPNPRRGNSSAQSRFIEGGITNHTKTLLVLGALTLNVFVYAQRDRPRVMSEEQQKMHAENFFLEGEKFYVLEDYTKAIQFFQQAVDLYPKEAAFHYKLAQSLSKSENDESLLQAAHVMDNCLKLERKNEHYYKLAANIYATLQKFDKAIDITQTQMRELPGNPENLFNLAVFQEYGGLKQEAINTYKKAEETLGITEQASLQKQKLLVEVGKTTEAITEAEKLLATTPDEPAYVLNLAELLSQNNQPDKALELLEKFDAENPGNGNIAMVLSGIYRDKGKTAKANQLMAQVFDDPAVETSSKIIFLGALTSEIQEARDKNAPNVETENFALGLAQKMETTAPDEASIFISIADLHIAMNNPQEGLVYYRKAVHLGVSDFEPWQNLLVLETQAGQIDSLIEHSEAAIEYFPNQGAVYYFNGYGLLRKRQYRSAAASLEQARSYTIDNDKLLAEILGLLGDCYNGSKQFSRSDEAYETALALDSNYDYVLNNYSFYLALRNEKLDKAETLATRLSGLFPDNATYQDTYGWVLYVAGKYKEARKVFEKIAGLKGANSAHFEHFGDVLFKLGETENALKQWEKAKSMGANHEELNKKIANRRIN